MDFCAVFLVVSLCKMSMSASLKYQYTEALETTTEFPTYIAEMGKGLTTISRGSYNVKIVNYGYNNLFNLTSGIFFQNNYVSLEKIQLRHNQICCIHQKAFRHLEQLKNVDLSENNLTNMEMNTFKMNTNLEKLDLTSNKIRFRNRPFLNSLSLATLILSDNRIEQIFEVNFTKLPNLRNLVLHSNVIFVIADNSFSPMKNLIYISLAHTGVYRISERMFANGSYPKIIDLTNTPLANKFDPPLRKVKAEGVMNLINIDKYEDAYF